MARRTAEVPAQPFPFCLALLTFAPLANLLALTVLELPRLAFEPVLRGVRMEQLLNDAQKSSAHVMLLASAGVCAAILCAGVRSRGKDPEVEKGTENEEGEETETGEEAVRGQSWARGQLLALLGPRETLWRRIGATIVVTCCAMPFLKLLTSGAAEALFALPARSLCAADGDTGSCSDALVKLVTGPLPENEMPPVSPILFAYATVYAFQAFALCFAFVIFGFSAPPGIRRGPLTTLLSTWAAYTAGATAYAAQLDVALGLGRSVPLSMSAAWQFVLPPSGLPHTLLAPHWSPASLPRSHGLAPA
ncbi:hypothetical protein [Streptomyces sp. 7N604]|uniref:hypothetical protein n=1 Tax=Streptomyces sp. 7N604 TaxID=3457415 RepID=UPI003FD3E7B3